MSVAQLDKYYNTVLPIAKSCGKIIRDAIRKDKNVQTKSSRVDLVTETDKMVEEVFRTKILSAFPDHKIIGEELTDAKDGVLTNAPTWIVDPIDGTMNFVHSNPNVCISIALLVNKVTEIGIVYNPVLEMLFTARRGKGAFLNGEQIHTSGQTNLADSMIISEFGGPIAPEIDNAIMNNFLKFHNNSHAMRALGSAALDMAWLAAGFVDGYSAQGLKSWDVAAGDLIVREAGGVVTDVDGGQFDLMSRRMLCAASKPLGKEMAASITLFKFVPREQQQVVYTDPS